VPCASRRARGVQADGRRTEQDELHAELVLPRIDIEVPRPRLHNGVDPRGVLSHRGKRGFMTTKQAALHTGYRPKTTAAEA
jgi:hypothetical protein